MIELIKYIKSNNLNVLFVIPKRCFEETEIKQLNNASKIIKQNELDIINFNTLDDFKVDFNMDFYNRAHLNVYGSTKYTLYFSKYLKENYKLKNHKEDEKYSSWNSEYERFKIDFNKLTGKKFDELI